MGAVGFASGPWLVSTPTSSTDRTLSPKLGVASLCPRLATVQGLWELGLTLSRGSLSTRLSLGTHYVVGAVSAWAGSWPGQFALPWKPRSSMASMEQPD